MSNATTASNSKISRANSAKTVPAAPFFNLADDGKAAPTWAPGKVGAVGPSGRPERLTRQRSQTVPFDRSSSVPVLDTPPVFPSSDEAPIRFSVPGLDTNSDQRFQWETTFPLALSGIISNEDYTDVVATANKIWSQINNKKKYKDALLTALAVTGGIMWLPMIPLLVLEHKRKKELTKQINGYLNTANRLFESVGLKWAMDHNANGLGLRQLCLEIDVSLLKPEQKEFFEKCWAQ